MKINTEYNLDEVVYLPFRIVGIHAELEGETKYKLASNFENDIRGYEILGGGYTISETELLKCTNAVKKTKVLCGFKDCVFMKDYDPDEGIGVCSREEIVLDEAVEDVFVGCPEGVHYGFDKELEE